MNEKPSLMRSLLWKDGKTLWPLLVAAATGIVLLNLLALVGASLFSRFGEGDLNIHTMIWILMPNLMALGAPALLVGGEEESGTLSWIRTLPVSAKKVVDSKFFVSVAAVFVTWLSSTLVMVVMYSILEPRVWATQIFTFWGITQQAFFTAFLLLVGFAVAYAIRSPIGGLITLVPIVSTLDWLVHRAGLYFLTGKTTYYRQMLDSVSSTRWIVLILAGAVLLGVTWALQRWLGRRRLTGPAKALSGGSRMSEPALPSAYRTPLPLGMQRPTQRFALLWQQIRQIGLPAILLTLMGVLPSIVLAIAGKDHTGQARMVLESLAVFAPMILFGCALWLGTLSFYGDSVRRRCAFFADRGISPSKVWWTRIQIPLLGCLIVAACALVLNTYPFAHQHARQVNGGLSVLGSPWIFLPVAFAFGQFASMWIKRPVLSFFAGPVFAFVTCMLLVFFFNNYDGAGWTALVLFPILLCASWRLCQRWLEGRVDHGFHARAIAYTVVGVVLPMLIVVGYRITTTPPLDTLWRSRAMSATNDITPDFDAFQCNALTRATTAWGQPGAGELVPDRIYKSVDAFRENLQLELEAQDSVGEFVSTYDMQIVFDPQTEIWGLDQGGERIEVRHETLKVALTWAKRIREAAAEGRSSLYELEWSVERIEPAVVRILSNTPDAYSNDVSELVAMIPSAELRRRSRKVALLSEWRRFQEPWSTKRFGQNVEPPRLFMSRQMYVPGWTGIERRRSERFLDRTVRMLWESLENGLPRVTSPEFKEQQRAWQSACNVNRGGWYDLPFAKTWTQDTEDAINRLRSRYPVKE